MANVNAGNVFRFTNGGQFLKGTDILLNIAAGSVRFMNPGRETWVHKDQSVIQGVYVGDDREYEVDIDLKVTDLGDTDTVITSLSPADASGLKTAYTATLKFPSYRGSATGFTIVFTNCYCPDGYEIQTSGGADSDTIKFKLKGYGTVTIAQY